MLTCLRVGLTYSTIIWQASMTLGLALGASTTLYTGRSNQTRHLHICPGASMKCDRRKSMAHSTCLSRPAIHPAARELEEDVHILRKLCSVYVRWSMTVWRDVHKFDSPPAPLPYQVANRTQLTIFTHTFWSGIMCNLNTGVTLSAVLKKMYAQGLY